MSFPTHRLHFPSKNAFQPRRFTGAIIQALLEQEPRLALHFTDDVGPMVGSWELCGGIGTGLLDDFFVVQNLTTGQFKVIDFQDSDTITRGLAQSPQFAGAAVMMYHPQTIRKRYGALASRITPGWFCDQVPWFTRMYRDTVKSIRAHDVLDRRLFFRGTIHGETPGKEYCRNGLNIREVALVLRDKYPDEVDISGYKLNRADWFVAAAKHRWVLTLPGHPWCYREFEMMSLAIPTLTLRWTSFLYHQPVYYIPVDGLERDPIGFALDPEAAADAIMNVFREVRDDDALMTSIGHQAQAWYDKHCSASAIASDMLTFLDLDRL